MFIEIGKLIRCQISYVLLASWCCLTQAVLKLWTVATGRSPEVVNLVNGALTAEKRNAVRLKRFRVLLMNFVLIGAPYLRSSWLFVTFFSAESKRNISMCCDGSVRGGKGWEWAKMKTHIILQWSYSHLKKKKYGHGLRFQSQRLSTVCFLPSVENIPCWKFHLRQPKLTKLV